MYQHPFRVGHRQGFSLVELLAVIAMTCFLSSLGAVAFNRIAFSRSATDAAEQIAGIIRSARTFAIAQNTYTVVGFRNAMSASIPSVEVSVSYSLDGNEPLASMDQSPTLAAKERLYRFKQVHIQPEAKALDKALADALPTSDQFPGLGSFESPFAVPSSQGSFEWRLLITPSGEMSLKTADSLTPTALIALSNHRSGSGEIPPASSAIILRGVAGQTSVVHP